ncbi:MAG: IS21 family transposase [Armatimonadetes bacterium]|nr:IS21 family transposase [Armatimonadota bacterium]
MLSKEDYLMIKAQLERGVYQKDIAAELGVHPRTIRRALRRGGPPRPTRERPSKLDPYKPLVDDLLKENVWNAVVILREIQAKGYDGGSTILRDYIHPKRVLRKSRATVRFETAPGRQMQSDWGEHWTEIAGRRTKIHFIVNTLGYSRRFHFFASEREDAEHTYEGIVRTFEYFGGSTQEVLVDNQKSCVIEHRVGDRVVFNDRFLDLAGHYGFQPRACRPSRAKTKGKDERMVGYVKHHFFVRYRGFENFSHLNQLAEQWLREEADPRVHGTVKEVVTERFERERPELQPLPPVRFDTSYREHRLVAWDGYVDVRGNRYSVPSELSGKMVVVRITLDDRLRVIWDETLVVEHPLRPRSEGWVTTPAHHRRLWQETLGVERRDLSVYEEVAQCS